MDNVEDAEQLRLKVALDATDTGVWEWDLQTDEVVWDERMERLFGYEEGEFPGTYEGFATRVHPDDRSHVEAAHERGIDKGFYEASFRVYFDGDTQRWVKSRAEIISDDGEPAKMVGIVTDITDHKNVETQLLAQNEQLEEFAQILSHDLRNPLTVAQLSLDLVADECESPHIEKIATAHERMEGLLTDLLLLARDGGAVRHTTPHPLSAVVRSCWETVQTKNATLELTTDQTILAEPGRLQRFFENLLRNAIEHGGSAVTVTVGALPTGFYLEDDGPGVPDHERANIWTQGYSTIDHGTGLGLGIVKEIATAHGWDIRLTDSPGGGARFEVTGVELEE